MQTLFRYLELLRCYILFPPIRAIVGVFWVCAGIGIGAAISGLIPDPTKSVEPVLMIVGAILGYHSFVRAVERRGVVELFSPGSAKEALWGATTGFCLFSTIIGIIFLLGGYSASINGVPQGLVSDLLVAVMGGVTEELVVRAVLFRILESWLGSWLALAISAAVFGAMHIANPNATVLSSAAIALEAGVMLAAAFMVTQRVWLPIGLHGAWNFTQGSIYGLPTSGHASTGFLEGHPIGPALISGGDFGPEASGVAVIGSLALGVYFLYVARSKGNMLPPSWRQLSTV